MWIFGYGSLVWKADFPYIKKVVGYVKGYERKFYQASIDHRGVPEKPGRVVTLIPSDDPNAKVWGVAYEIKDSDTETISALSSREKRYEQFETLFYQEPLPPVLVPVLPAMNDERIMNSLGANSAQGESGEGDCSDSEEPLTLTDFKANSTTATTTTLHVTTFIGDTRGPLFLGYAPTYDIAMQIALAEGPSGSNRDYLFHLSHFMKTQLPNVTDTHLFDIEKELVEILSKEDKEKSTRVWGVVYKIHKRDVDFVIKHLDMREVMGYEKVPAEFFPVPTHPLNIFDAESPHSIQISTIAQQNSEYYKNLEASAFMGEGESEIDSDSGRGSFTSEEAQTNGDNSDTDNESIGSGSSDEDDFDVLYGSVRNGHPFIVTMYFGDQTNEHYIGASTLSTMALQIFESRGASGSNREYLFKLAEAMREICTEALDAHLMELERAVRSLEGNQAHHDACIAGMSAL